MQEKTLLPMACASESIARIQLENGVAFSIGKEQLPLLIGRGASCGLTIPSGHVSRKHCELYLVNGALCLKDMSSNGTLVGNRLIKQGSVSIASKTEVFLAEEVLITITPASDADTNPIRDPAEPKRQERRQDERRNLERRQEQSVVQFERRWSEGRRERDRRDEDD